MTSPTKREELLNSAKAFCTSFADKVPIDTILSHFSRTHQITVIEHGDPSLAPFLGRPYNGTNGVTEYFETISSHLSYGSLSFSEYVVDAESRKVAMKGKGKFTWLSTGDSWDETFAYVLDFDDEGLVTDYQVWADTGAVYLASKGELGKLKG